MRSTRIQITLAVGLLAACGTANRADSSNDVDASEPVVKACDTNVDCAAGQSCNGGICVDPKTTEAADAGETTPAAPEASPFQCKRCRTTADCGPDGVCLLDGSTVGGSCGLKCATRTDCPVGNTCAGNEALVGGTVRTCFPATLTCPHSGEPFTDGLDNTGGTTGGGTTGGGTTGGGTTGGGTTGGGTSADPVDMCTPCAASSECGDGICLRDPDLGVGMCGPTCVDSGDCETGASCVTIGSATTGVRGKACFPDAGTCTDWGASTGGGTTGGGTTGGGTTPTAPVPGGFCSTCTSDSDCDDGFCLTDSTQNIGVCGTTCLSDATCETGAECIDIYGGRNRYLGSNCFPISETCAGWGGGTTGGGTTGGNASAYVCDYCETDSDCGSGGYCLWDDGTWEGSCGSSCNSSSDCPTGTICGMFEKFEGLFDYVRACFPRANTCSYY